MLLSSSRLSCSFTCSTQSDQPSKPSAWHSAFRFDVCILVMISKLNTRKNEKESCLDITLTWSCLDMWQVFGQWQTRLILCWQTADGDSTSCTISSWLLTCDWQRHEGKDVYFTLQGCGRWEVIQRKYSRLQMQEPNFSLPQTRDPEPNNCGTRVNECTTWCIRVVRWR